MADTVMVYNHDIYGLVRRIDRFREEFSHAVSAGVHHFQAADLERFKTYLSALNTYMDHVQSEPQLDLPESHPKPVQVEPAPEMPAISNESISDLQYLIELCRTELVNSQSSRMPCRLIDFDEKRFRAVIQKMQRFITDYVETVLPLDLPESSPKSELAPHGRLGT